MRTLQFKQIDVFTASPLRGNPVAVVFGADDLSDGDMARFANWTNLSETTFVQRSTVADYRLRIFTPQRELPFAGHPTIGSAHAIRKARLLPKGATHAVQECGAGLIPLSFSPDGTIHARAPRPKRAPFAVDNAALRASIGGADAIAPIAIDVGPIWITARLESLALLDHLAIDAGAMTRYTRSVGATGVTLYAIDGNDAPAIHVRSFAPGAGVLEDPVCGTGNVSVGAHLRLTGLLARVGTRYVAHQGKHCGRDGRVGITIEGEDVLLGGTSMTILEGTASM